MADKRKFKGWGEDDLETLAPSDRTVELAAYDADKQRQRDRFCADRGYHMADAHGGPLCIHCGDAVDGVEVAE